MNQVYIAHVFSDTMVSKVIGAISRLNYPDVRNIVHTALVYENDQGKKFIAEASIDTNIHHVSLDEFKKMHEGENLKIQYTPLGNIIPKSTSTKNSFQEFEKFLDTHYENSQYSIQKAMKSMDIEELEDLNVFELFETKLNEHRKKVLGGYTDANYKEVVHDVLEIISQELENIDHKKEAIKIHLLAEGSSLMSEENVVLLKDAYEIEANNTDSDRKFFYCTEFVLEVVKDWTDEIKIPYPNILNVPEIQIQDTYKIYPQKLYDILNTEKIDKGFEVIKPENSFTEINTYQNEEIIVITPINQNTLLSLT